MLNLTGFVLIDTGILTLTRMARKTDPTTVTPQDLDAAADYLEQFYSQGIGKSLAAGVVFPNSGFVQSEYDKPKFQHKRRAWADFVLRGHRGLALEPILQALDKKEYRAMVLHGVDDAPTCAFTGQPAYLRVSRDMLPMLNGRGIMNFGPMGEAGLPVSATTLLAIHAMPLGCVITQGALLAVESDDSELLSEFVRANHESNQRFIHLSNQNGYEKFPNVSSYRTRLMDVLVAAFRRAEERADIDSFRAPSLTAYHFSNNGTSARITLYPLPSSTVQFVWEAGKDDHAAVWQRIVARGRTQAKPESEELNSKTPKLTQRNLVYEDLFDLPENAHMFLRTYFLRHPRKRFKDDMRGLYDPFAEAELISWKLTELFLKRIMGMKKNRTDQIRALGDRLAAHIQQQDDRRLLKDLYYERQYWRFRAALLRTMYGYSGDEPLVSFDGYVQIFAPFEEGQGVERADWNLARDLLLIRIFEQLHLGGYWSTVAETLKKEDEDDDDDELTPVTD